jgi:hypothetical protein
MSGQQDPPENGENVVWLHLTPYPARIEDLRRLLLELPGELAQSFADTSDAGWIAHILEGAIDSRFYAWRTRDGQN